MKEEFEKIFNEHNCLPPGYHEMTWGEVKEKFNFSKRRKELIAKVEPLLSILKDAGCTCLYIDGSFVTNKIAPGDIDILYNADNPAMAGEAMVETDCILECTPKNRELQKDKYGAEVFYCHWIAQMSPEKSFLEFFQQFKGNPKIEKGIVKLDLKNYDPKL